MKEEEMVRIIVERIPDNYIPSIYSMFLMYFCGNRNSKFEEALVSQMKICRPEIVEAFEACERAGLGYPV